MKALPKALYFLSFVGLISTGALALNGSFATSIAPVLMWAVVVGSLVAAPVLVHHKAEPATLILAVLAGYALMRWVLPLPGGMWSPSDQYRFYSNALYQGAVSFAQNYFPLSISAHSQLALLTACCMFWLAVFGGFIAFAMNKPLPSIVFVLGLLAFSFTVDTSRRSLGTAIAFLGFAGCLMVLSRGIALPRWHLREMVAGCGVVMAAALASVVFLTAVPSVTAQPSQDWRSWNPFQKEAGAYTYDWLENYPSLLDPTNKTTIMTVQSDKPSYWKANTLDEFTGSAWLSSVSHETTLTGTRSGTGYIYKMPQTKPPATGATVTEKFTLLGVDTNRLFVGGTAQTITSELKIGLRADDSGGIQFKNAAQPSPFNYSITAVISELKPSDLIGRGSVYPGSVKRYLDFPVPLLSSLDQRDKNAQWRATVQRLGPTAAQWSELYELNSAIIGDATDPYDKTLRIEGYLKTNYTYTLEPPDSSYSSPYAAFLFDTHMGYCQHFAGAMALLLRYNGIPSRVAVGFATGSVENGEYVVAANDAHAWVEAFFPSVGWVAFDPTPGQSLPTPGPSSSSPGFTSPFTNSSGSQSVRPSNPEPPPQQNSPTPEATTSSSGGELVRLLSLIGSGIVGGFLALAIGFPIVRRWLRTRGLRRGPMVGRIGTSLRLLRSDLALCGFPAGATTTVEETLAILRNSLGIIPKEGFSERIEAVLFGDRPATSKDFERCETLRHETLKRLRKRQGWVRAGLTWYGLPLHKAANEGVKKWPGREDLAR